MTTPTMQAWLPKGYIDINMELWQQNIIDWYNEEIANGNIENLGPTYEGGPQFFMIPMWVHEQYGISTVFDMKDRWELFKDPEDPSKGQFISCVIGWQCAEINMVKMEAYGLTEFYNVISPDTAAAMDAALAEAQKKQEPVFGYYWAPTAIMGAYDWWVLEEPPYDAAVWETIQAAQQDTSLRPLSEAVAYPSPPVDKGVHKGLRDKAPDVYEVLKKMNVGLEPINKTAAWALENDIQGNWERAAIYYLETY
jgi:glycine betaine/proline transport system substrate-binding protein